MTGKSENVLTNLNFSLVNFIKIFDRDEFFQVLLVTLFYTVFGTVGALLLGLLANKPKSNAPTVPKTV